VQTRITKISFKLFLAAILTVLANALNPATATATTASEIDRNVTQALITLYQTTPGAKALADSAKGILVFPSIVKGGFIVAGQYGDGALRKNGKTVGYYRSLQASVGF
jgi:lipid-binding SYLF domain-containing protein